MKRRIRWTLIASAALAVLASAGCSGGSGSGTGAAEASFDPLAFAAERKLQIGNLEAPVQPQCYTKTDGVSNPCWTCHTGAHARNHMGDAELQEEYAFSEYALDNRWSNLFANRAAAIGAISDDAALAWIREDNYTPLMEAMRSAQPYFGWRPDLDLRRGFDGDGLARDGSWWRAFRYKPFAGTFWPTNGSTDDVMIRLPRSYWTGADGKPSVELYKANLAILEAAMTSPPEVEAAAIVRHVEPVDESVAGLDLDADGTVGGVVDTIRGLPATYAGQTQAVRRWVYPLGTEFLHTVRYVDPDGGLSKRIKEVRYMVKRDVLDDNRNELAYIEEIWKKQMGLLPYFPGAPQYGIHNEFGWQLHAFIEDGQGRLRLQTYEEHYYCMGCHTNLGVTVDQTFGYPRKVPGARGWGHQTLTGLKDVPQSGHAEPEILTYFRRVGAADEFRANTEMLERFWPGGVLDEAAVRRAAPGGDKDLAWLLTPSRSRALQLTKAYMVTVREQRYDLGRDTLLAPPANVHAHIDNGDTGLAAGAGVFTDGRMWLNWP